MGIVSIKMQLIFHQYTEVSRVTVSWNSPIIGLINSEFEILDVKISFKRPQTITKWSDQNSTMISHLFEHLQEASLD